MGFDIRPGEVAGNNVHLYHLIQSFDGMYLRGELLGLLALKPFYKDGAILRDLGVRALCVFAFQKEFFVKQLIGEQMPQ